MTPSDHCQGFPQSKLLQGVIQNFTNAPELQSSHGRRTTVIHDFPQNKTCPTDQGFVKVFSAKNFKPNKPKWFNGIAQRWTMNQISSNSVSPSFSTNRYSYKLFFILKKHFRSRALYILALKYITDFMQAADWSVARTVAST